jgi:alkylation response protein AidB-like acyl-CoA dehydrogenase
MSDLITEQFTRLLDGLPAGDPWPALAESGFLDLMRSEDDGGAGLDLAGLFPLALAMGARPSAPPVIQTMLARLVSPEAQGVADLEQALVAGGGAAETARALAAATTAALMAGAMAAVEAMALEYASTRKQFGREISKFQAVQHQLAVLAEEAAAARMAAQAAFVGAPLAISPLRAGVAKARCGQAALQVAAIAHAVHGAIGVSQEYPLHPLTRALHKGRLAHGGEGWWARRLGAWALAEREDFVSLARRL